MVPIVPLFVTQH